MKQTKNFLMFMSTLAVWKLPSHVKRHTAPATAEVQQGQTVLHLGPGDVQIQHRLLGLGQGGRLLLRLSHLDSGDSGDAKTQLLGDLLGAIPP